MIQTVKLAKLRLSPINVRTADAAALALEPLAADIAARGVLQNLLVSAATKPRGTFEVFDGGRRLRALQLLADAGTIDAADYDVPVLILKADPKALSETSLAANFHQLKLTPAEECRAFQHFLGVDGDIDAVAKRFGQTRRFIEGRLRLASLAEPIFDALASGKITLDVAKAYASTDNHARQLAVWETYRAGYASADTIRRVISQNSITATSAVALLVGETAYVAAGGNVDRDLFSDGADNWTDPEIADRLADEVMQAEAQRLIFERGLAWVRPIRSSYSHNHSHGLFHVSLEQPPLDQDQETRLATLNARMEEIEAATQDDEMAEDAFSALIAELDQLHEQMNDIENRPPTLPEGLKPHVGMFLLLTPQGAMELDSRYYSEVPITRAEDPVAADEDGDTDEQATGGTRETSDGGNRFVDGYRIGDVDKSDEDIAGGPKPISARLSDELAMQRRDVLAASILDHPELALDYMLFALIDTRISHAARDIGSSLRAPRPDEPIFGDMPASRARDAVSAAHEALDSDWTTLKTVFERFDAFRMLADDAKASWMTWIVAATLETRPMNTRGERSLHDSLASIMDVDVAAWWRPTAENYFDRVSKSTIVGHVMEVGGPALAGRNAALKKSEMAASCEKLFAGGSIVEAEVKTAAIAWLPDAMRFTAIGTSDSHEAIDDQTIDDEVIDDEAIHEPDDSDDDNYSDVDDDDTLSGSACDDFADQFGG